MPSVHVLGEVVQMRLHRDVRESSTYLLLAKSHTEYLRWAELT